MGTGVVEDQHRDRSRAVREPDRAAGVQRTMVGHPAADAILFAEHVDPPTVRVIADQPATVADPGRAPVIDQRDTRIVGMRHPGLVRGLLPADRG